MRIKNNRCINCLLLLYLLLAAFPVQAQKAKRLELEKIKAYCRQLLLSDTAYATEQTYRVTDDIVYETDGKGYYQNLDAEGKWPDLDYSSQVRGDWRPSWHLYRTMLVLREYHKQKDPAYLASVHLAIGFWIKNDFICENWWQNNINTPFAYSSLILMLGKDASTAELDYLHHVIVKRIPVHKATGQNLIWQLDNEARIALIDQNYNELSIVLKKMQAVAVISTQEGIQPDYSFQQHGPMLQFGNYGLHFTNSMLFWMAVTKNTGFAFERDKQQVVLDYFSNGLRWSVFKGDMDLLATGRQLRENSGSKRGENLQVNSQLINALTAKSACKYKVPGFGNIAECGLIGNKSFWRSDYMVQQLNSKYMMSLKMHGPYVKRIEAINGENLKGAFLNDGVTLFQTTGKEYKDIEPLWNWSMLPGTTSDTTINASSRVAIGSANQGKYTAQVSNGTQGIATMDYLRVGVKAKKSYFFVDGMMVALGAGIQGAAMKNMVTTVDQKFHDQALIKGQDKYQKNWIWADSTAYFFADSLNRIITKVEKRTGNWGAIDQSSGNKPVSGTIFSAFITHHTADHYAYAVMPVIGLKETRNLVMENEFIVILNNSAQQVVDIKGTIMAVFHIPGKFVLPDHGIISSDHPCLMILEKKGKEQMISIADPSRQLQQLTLSIAGKSKVVQLPQGENRGNTVQMQF